MTAWELPSRRSLPATWPEFTAALGDTPLLRLRVRVTGRQAEVCLKLEDYNPFGSVKDRTAAGLLIAAEAEHPPGSRLHIVESTSGNLGVALAALCRLRGHRFTAVVDPRTSTENLARLKEFGARTDLVTEADEHGGYLEARLKRVTRHLSESPDAVWTNQYGNPANPLAHFAGSGPELVRQNGSRLAGVFVAVSTGGTFAGIARYLRKVSPGTRVVAVDSVGSAALGGPLGPRLIPGLGASRPSAFAACEFVNEREWLSDAEAVAAGHTLAAQTGLVLGGSASAALAAFLRHAARGSLADGGQYLCLCADDGRKYLDTLYDDRWLDQAGIDPSEHFDRLSGTRFEPSVRLPRLKPTPPPGRFRCTDSSFSKSAR
ncbi:pyridoxal-phosphate dependent enzyme [Amycolatopsis samaneae]|uniref:Pyridoxal-phosphate dependent enzyme n=1 Tax=Amycolatopsis samaneae TaxID=664691 RepID=A0ABW5GP99_9PSEU